jgi:hypothetical protein
MLQQQKIISDLNLPLTESVPSLHRLVPIDQPFARREVHHLPLPCFDNCKQLNCKLDWSST